MTFGTTASQSHARRDPNPALVAALAIAVIAAATLAGAWFLQLVLDIRPCPLCLEQRYAYYLAIPLRRADRARGGEGCPARRILAGLALLALATLGNAGLGTYHAGVEWGFWQGPTDCTGPVGISAAPAICSKRLDTVRWSAATKCSGVFSACRWPATMC